MRRLSDSFAEVEKRWIIGLVVAITVALAGLIAIQVHWMRSTLAVREAQFHASADNALIMVSEQLERLERMRELRKHAAGRRLLLRLDSLRQGVPPLPPAPPFAPTDSVPPAPVTGLHARPDMANGDQADLVHDMVRAILASELQQDIRSRIDPALLDSLLRAEFGANNIAGPWTYSVHNANGEEVWRPDEHEPRPADTGDPHKVRLFRHDLVGPAYYLHVDLPGHHRAILRGMLPLIVVSLLFTLVVVAAFYITMRTIFRQKRLGRIRSDLVNNLTHELKTPISTIGLACEALTDPSVPKTEEQVRTFVGMIRDENKRLGALVQNVLQSAVMADGQMVLKPVDLDLHAVINDVVRASNMQVSRRNGRIEAELKAEIHHVEADRTHMTNLLYNLIDNAVKYTEQEPRIRIATRSDNEGVTISVTDNGIGIPAAEQRKIFDRLYRVPTGNLHNAKGFGLGLSYVRTVVQRHHGRIRVESAPGAGSTFHIFIPFEHVRSD